LPSEYYALAEQVAGTVHPDVLALRTVDPAPDRTVEPIEGATAVLDAPPRVSTTAELTEDEAYLLKRHTIAIRHATGDQIVAMIEILSPGNKASSGQLELLFRKFTTALQAGCSLLVIDLHPPGKHDPQGIHGAYWSYLSANSFRLPAEKRQMLVAYEAGLAPRAYIEPIGVGQTLPEMPLFLEHGWYINVPLEPNYADAFAAVPKRWRDVIEGGESVRD
jgi:hypothetical protein